MPKINVYLPDELADAVREAGVPVSAVCQRALEQAVRRVGAIRAFALSDLDDSDLAARLPHFTARGRTVLKLAVAQARGESAPSISTKHLLGGLLAEGDNLGVRVLRAMEIDAGQVGRELARQTSTEDGRTSTEDGRTSTEDGRMSTDDGHASAKDGRAAGGGGTAHDGAPQLSGPAVNALEAAVTEAAALGHNYVGNEHLLIGLCAEPDGAAGQVLRALGAEPKSTRRAVVAALAGYVHLHAQTQAAESEKPASQKPADPGGWTAALRQELQPLIARIERLEQRAN